MIPVEFLPNYELKTDSAGNFYYVGKNGIDTMKLKTKDIGLILMDTWDDKDEKTNLSPWVIKQKRFLEKARKSNITIIHSPNYPDTERYDQYHFLKKIVKDSLDKYESFKYSPVFLKGVSKFDNEVFNIEKRFEYYHRLLSV